MKIRDAVTRGVRTAAQALAAGLLSLPAVTAIAEVVTFKEAALVALFQAVISGLVSFLQNFSEDNSSLEIPK